MAGSPDLLVTVDIGGTHARFAVAKVAKGRVVAVGEAVTLNTSDHASFDSAWEAFVRYQGGTVPRAAAIAVAAPVAGEVIKFTNNSWTIRPALIAGRLGLDAHLLLNDFAAVGHAVVQAGPEHFLHLTGPDAALPDAGTISVVGPGTGLGVAHVWRGEGGYRVQTTEGGHIAFAPLDGFEDALLARLRQRHGRVSVERVVAGPGIVDMYETLAIIEGRHASPLGDKLLWQRALSGEDDLAVAALERFCRSLGSVAGDIVLAQGGGALVLAGGLGQRLMGKLATSGFAERFRAKGRFAGLMATLSVKIITHPQPGLFGAAAAFARAYTA